MLKIQGELEIDQERGVIYFHSHSYPTVGATILRICSLPTPIPDVFDNMLDITHMIGTSWSKDMKVNA